MVGESLLFYFMVSFPSSIMQQFHSIIQYGHTQPTCKGSCCFLKAWQQLPTKCFRLLGYGLVVVSFITVHL